MEEIIPAFHADGCCNPTDGSPGDVKWHISADQKAPVAVVVSSTKQRRVLRCSFVSRTRPAAAAAGRAHTAATCLSEMPTTDGDGVTRLDKR